MQTISLGKSELKASSVILGLMRIASMEDAEIRKLVGTALEAGITMIDHADIYGRPPVHTCEARFADAMKLTPADRAGMVIQTKAGIREGSFDFSEAHLLASVDGSLKALKTEYIDVFLLHRPDTLVEPEEVAAAFDKLHASGKVRHFGVSNQTPGQIELLKSAVRQPLLVNQMQLSITHAPMIAQGIAMNMEGAEQSEDRTLGILDYSRLKGMTIQAWSPTNTPSKNRFWNGDQAWIVMPCSRE